MRGHMRQQSPGGVLVQFQSPASVRSEGPAVNSPVREGGEHRPFDSPEARRADTNRAAPMALRYPSAASTPPSRTGLLTAGPSDLRAQDEPVPCGMVSAIWKTEIRTLVGALRHSPTTAVTGHQPPFTVSSEQPKRAHQVVSKTERPG
jgi:hypothetical protein